MTPVYLRAALALHLRDTADSGEWVAAWDTIDAALPLLIELWEATTRLRYSRNEAINDVLAKLGAL